MTNIVDIPGPCGRTWQEHYDSWCDWTDNCDDRVTGCGYAEVDVMQCATDHPDDGVTSCPDCGFGVPEVIPECAGQLNMLDLLAEVN
jgi:hypothetical protein